MSLGTAPDWVREVGHVEVAGDPAALAHWR